MTEYLHVYWATRAEFRISLQIEKPEILRNTPDLLYALRMYLTGDSGANTIVISGVSDDD